MMRTLPGHLLAAVRAFVVLSLLLGTGYPLLVFGIGQAAFHANANGSLVTVDGLVVGSDLIGQPFTDGDGTPLPKYFQPRPSAAGKGYDPLASAASNRGPEDVADSPDNAATDADESRTSLLTQVCVRSAEIGAANNVDGGRTFCANGVGTPGKRRSNAPAAVPPDAVTASASGLDPHISPAYARLQVNRVALARGVPAERVNTLVQQYVQGRTMGFLGEPRVNVVLLNLALDRLQ